MIDVAVYLADQNPQRDRSMGITNMTDCLLSELEKRDDVQLTPVMSKSSYDPAANTAKIARDERSLSCIRFPWRTDNRVARVLTDNLHPLFVSQSFDLWYYPKGYISYLTRPETPTVGTIHDVYLQHYADHYPNFRSSIDYTYWLGLLKSSIRKLDLILTVSKHSRNCILQFCDRHGLSAPPIVVTYEGSPYEKFSGDMPMEGNFVLHLASKEPQKKTAHFIRMWNRLDEQGEALPPLKLVGSLPDEVAPLVQQNSGMRQLPKQPEDDFIHLMRSAQALVLPSELEGFGLPALEAYYLGTPVCYVEGTTIDEILNIDGQGGFSLDDDDTLIKALSEVRQMTRTQIQKIRRNLRNKYALERVSDRVMNAFHSVA